MYYIIRNTSPSFISRFIRSTFISTENKKKPMFNGSTREDTYLQREGRQMVQLPRPPTLRIFPLTFSSRKRMEKKKGRKLKEKKKGRKICNKVHSLRNLLDIFVNLCGRGQNCIPAPHTDPGCDPL